ncbi:hypothetical protein PLESTF_000155400 [Pleodorina starrii]|nr:hypothetical protein PLESTF_000155400 [Pleodorina starrii]
MMHEPPPSPRRRPPPHPPSQRRRYHGRRTGTARPANGGGNNGGRGAHPPRPLHETARHHQRPMSALPPLRVLSSMWAGLDVATTAMCRASPASSTAPQNTRPAYFAP